MVRFALWLIATTTLLKMSKAHNGFELYKRFYDFQTCKDITCDSDRVCVELFKPICLVKNDSPCKDKDICEGGNYCPSTKVCVEEPGGIPEGSPCPVGVGCKPDLYCERNQNKCVKIPAGSNSNW